MKTKKGIQPKYPLVLFGMVLILINFGTGFGNLSTLPSCGTTTITFYIWDGDTVAPIAATLTAPEGTFTATIQNTPSGFRYPQAGVATIPNMNYGDTVQFSASNYTPFSQQQNYCPTVGTTMSVIATVFMNPINIINTATTTETFINYVNSTFYSTVSGTTVTSVSSITQTLTLPPLVTTQIVTQSGTTYTTTALAYYTITHGTTQIITQTVTAGSHSFIRGLPIPVLAIIGIILIILGILI